ncbi:MAG: S8 family serine peptidase [Alphaproteobacteria bacterium]
MTITQRIKWIGRVIETFPQINPTMAVFYNYKTSQQLKYYLSTNILAYGLGGILKSWSGSSVATPLISAEAADLLSAHSGLSAAQIVQAIVHDTVALVGVQNLIA